LQYQLNRNSIPSSALQHQHTNIKLLSNKPEEDLKLAENETIRKQYQELIDNLKESLVAAKDNNEDFTELISQTQLKQAELQKENSSLKEQNISAKKDLEKFDSIIEETKVLIESQKVQAEVLDAELSELRKEKKLLQEKLFLTEEQIINLISIHEGHLKTKKDNLDCIDSLKQTIEIIKKGGGSDEENILEAKIKIEEMENTINQKNYLIKTMSDSIANFDKDREFFNLTLNNSKEEIADKDKFEEELEDKYRSLYSDYEKANMRAGTLQVLLNESEQTITNLKISINFINETMEEYKEDYVKLQNQLESEKGEKNKMLKSIEITKEKFVDLIDEIEDLQESKITLQSKLLEAQKALKEKKTMFKKSNFDKSSLEQQLQEAKSAVETLKEELKYDKFTKLNEEFQNEIAKSNEERLKKTEEMRSQLEAKGKECEKSQEVYSQNIKAKDDRLKELTKLLSKAESINGQNERHFNEKVFKLNNALEQQKAELQQAKLNAENEKRNFQYQTEEFQRQVKEMQMRLKSSEENYSNLFKKNYETSSIQVKRAAPYNEVEFANINNYDNVYSNAVSNNFRTGSGAVDARSTYVASSTNTINAVNQLQSNSSANNYVTENANVKSNFWNSLGNNPTESSTILQDYEANKASGTIGSTYFNAATANMDAYYGAARQINNYSADYNAGSNYRVNAKSGTNSAAVNFDANLNFERLPKTIKSGFDKMISENTDIFNIGNGRISKIKNKINTEELDKLDLSDVNELLSD